MDARIRPERIQTVAAILFGEDRFAGPRIADLMIEPHITLWSWLNRRGMPVERAERLAELMDEHAGRLMVQARLLRSEAAAARRAHADAQVVAAGDDVAGDEATASADEAIATDSDQEPAVAADCRQEPAVAADCRQEPAVAADTRAPAVAGELMLIQVDIDGVCVDLPTEWLADTRAPDAAELEQEAASFPIDGNDDRPAPMPVVRPNFGRRIGMW